MLGNGHELLTVGKQLFLNVHIILLHIFKCTLGSLIFCFEIQHIARDHSLVFICRGLINFLRVIYTQKN